jgi:choice-of-anchor C domain-containing protein
MRMGIARPLAAMLTAGLAVLAFSADSRANLIVNGSFESGSAPAAVPGYATLPGGDTSISGWTVMPSSIDWINNSYWQSADGTYSLDLSGLAPGGIEQTVSTNVGETYTLSFQYSVNPDQRHTEVARRMDIYVKDSSNVDILNNNILLSRGTRTFADMQWLTETYTFVATSTTSTIQFVSSPLNIDAGGPALDNVVLTGNPVVNPVPAPPALLLAGLGFGFFAIRRRK